MTYRLVRHERVQHLRATCRACDQPIVHVVAVGWFDPDRPHPYDVCPTDRFGNHSADPATIAGWLPPAR